MGSINAAFLSILGVFAVGFIDYLTGIEIRAFPLYFFPLMIAAWHLGKIGSLLISLLAAITWIVAMYFGGREYSRAFVWVVNFFTQFSAFILVSLIVVRLKDALINEQFISRTDKLTGLLNSRAFYEQSHTLLKLCQRHERPLTLAYIDLDNFKNANDTLGHLHGDFLLGKVGSVLKASLRSSDLVGRLGGDEFAILLPEMSPTSAREALENIRSRIEEIPELISCAVTASIGVVSYIETPSDINQLIKTADELMYKAKKMGKNYVIAEKF